MSDHNLAIFKSGIQNLVAPELIAVDAAQDSLGWLTKDGKLVLSYGRNLIGQDSGNAGKISGLWFGYKVDGSKVMYRKISTKIQYLKGATWTDIITGLTADADYVFANYSSAAGSFTYVGGADGLWKIINANPENPINVTNGIYKGKIMIDKNRMFMWNIAGQPTNLFYSHADAQKVGTQYTHVTGEATASLTGTLAFKAGGVTRSCFGVVITLTGTGEVYTDNNVGGLSGSLGGTGTINYATGAYTISASGVGTAVYTWEDSNSTGVSDFSFSGTRLVTEGNVIPQTEGGDAILNVLIGQDGVYYSEKSQSFYSLTLEVTDLTPLNQLYRKDLGIPSFRAGISTNKGIVFMNTANPAKPEMTILQKSIVTNNIEPTILFSHFKFANYDYSDCAMDTWERYTIVFCKKIGSPTNDTMLMCDVSAGTVDAVPYAGRCSAKDAGNLYIGSPLIENVYQVFNGFDDDSNPVTNYWTSKADQYQMAQGVTRMMRYQIGERLKKYRKQKVKGMIAPGQNLEIYIDCDSSGFQLAGTIRSDGDYVDYSSPQTIGSNMVGEVQYGGDQTVVAYPYFTEFKVKLPKFRTRTIMLKATGIGYCDVQFLSDWEILIFEQRLPTRFRQKMNVSLDGATSNIPEA